jgi:hypothetical protein
VHCRRIQASNSGQCPGASVAHYCAFHVFRNYKEMATFFERVVKKYQETTKIPTSFVNSLLG